MKINPTFLLGSFAAACFLLAPTLHAQTANPTVLYTFTQATNGNDFLLTAPLVPDGAGSFYGVTPQGGDNRAGTIYKITPGGSFTTIFQFDGATNGYAPLGAVTPGSDGTLYGTTSGNHPDDGTGNSGSGTVYKLSPAGVLTTLHVFNQAEGSNPLDTLVFGPDGRLYGTTAGGGANNLGTVFAVTVDGVLTTLHSFAKGDGTSPHSALVLGKDGNFYGTTSYDGDSSSQQTGSGSVFKITPTGTFTVLHLFTSSTDGRNIYRPLVQGEDGFFYGVATNGGANRTGTVFKVTPDGAFTVLHAFAAYEDIGTNDGGASPAAALANGGDGKFYGTTSSGGLNAVGTLFSIAPDGTFKTLYDFPAGDEEGANPVVGSSPFAKILRAADGKLYLPLNDGGANGRGTIVAFSLVTSPSSFFAGEMPLSNGVYYLSFANGTPFGYYSYLSDPRYIYHFDLGYEYIYDAADGVGGVFFYDFASSSFFYTSPTFPFPYVYDFSAKSVLYYYPDTANAGHYTSGPRYFYNFSTGSIITK